MTSSGATPSKGRIGFSVRDVIFSLTLLLSAALLFSVQPMTARLVLPRLGGSPAVWTTCSLFFQSALLLGYAGAHLATRLLSHRAQAIAFVGLLVASVGWLAISGPSRLALPAGCVGDPTGPLLLWLVRAMGLPFVSLAATAPLLQAWFSLSRGRPGRDPYFLYSASNLGSLLALVAYPLVIERTMVLDAQWRLWGYVLGSAPVFVGVSALSARSGGTRRKGLSSHEVLSRGQVLTWVLLAFLPSSLMLGLTAYISTDLAAIPLLWVIPLALYLITFVIAFGRFGERAREVGRGLLPILLILITPVLAVGLVQPWWMPLHLAYFFVAALACHAELVHRRPEPTRLTSFYLALSVGGVLGGVFNALVAPVVFDRLVEYPIVLVLAYLVPGLIGQWPGNTKAWRSALAIPALVWVIVSALCANWGGIGDSAIGAVLMMVAAGLTCLSVGRIRTRPLRFGLTMAALIAGGGLATGLTGRVLLRSRDFFGVLSVTEDDTRQVRRLFHGSTLHGQQSTDPARKAEPSTYFDRTGPVGDVFAMFEARPASERLSVGITGLGVGSLASYACPGQHWRFFEIDPAVVRVARDEHLFTFLRDSQADSLEVVVGDARLALGAERDRGFDLLILDAFASDSIPVHLLTREAIRLYRRKLKSDGLLVFNISNRYIDFAPVLAGLAGDSGMTCRVRVDLRPRSEEEKTGVRGSIWAVLSNSEQDLGAIGHDPRWETPAIDPSKPVWRDDFADLFGQLRLGPLRRVHEGGVR